MKQKCKIVNQTAGDLGETYAIPEHRQEEISKGMDEMVKEFGKGIRYACDVYSRIEDLCNTQEEFVWAITNHIQWLAATGRLVPSIKKQP